MSIASRALLRAGLLAGLPALAQAQPTTTLPPVEVFGQRPGSLTAPSPAAQREALEQTPAAVRFLDGRDHANRYAFTLRDVLADTPGVFVQNRYGQELRLSIRGSGIARGFHLRGVEVLQDGIPVNLADGSGDFYQLDPLAIRTAAVYPGGNGLAHGASSLGGAVNFITPTARTAESPHALRVEGGSYGTWRLSGQTSAIVGDWDALAIGSVTHADGWRQHSRSQYEQFNANVGYRVNDRVETRFYAGAYIIRQQLPGTLSLRDALNRPTIASASAISGNQARNVWSERFANRTSVQLDVGQVDIDSWVIHKRLYHPIFQVIDQDGLTWGIAPRWSGSFTVGGLRNDLVLGARYFAGTNDADQYVNLRGSRGRQTLSARQRAANYEIFAENRLWVLPNVALVAGAKALHDERTYQDYGAGLTSSRGAVTVRREYDGFNPKLGLLWQPRPAVQVFANITRSQDVPDFSDLAQVQAGTTALVPLQAQRAWTVEAGTRGRRDGYGWDVALFRSNINGQLLQYTVSPGVPASTFNAGTTVNQGVEAAGMVDLARGIAAEGDRVTLRQVWTWNDFRFRGDPQYRNNRIAGLPPHVLRTSLTYAQAEGHFVAPVLDWVPRGAWADYANTLRANQYVKLGLEAGLRVGPGVSLFLDARNLTNKRYVTDLGTIQNARAPGANTAVFYPGEGRSVFVGARLSF